MSMMKLCGFAETSPAAGSASAPTGLGALNVPSFSQTSCQRDSMSAASAAVYLKAASARKGSVASPAAPEAGVVSLMVLQAPSVSECEPAEKSVGGPAGSG